MYRPEQELSPGEARARAARGVVSVLGRHALLRLFAFLGTLVLARLIAPESFGLFVTAQFILSVLLALAVGGITSAIVRRRQAMEPADYRTALTIQQLLAVVVVAALVLAAPVITAAYGLAADRAWVFRIMALAVFPLSLRSIPQAMLQRNLRHDLTAVCEVVEYVVYLVMAIGLALYGADIWALVVATLARYVVGAVVMQLMARTLPHFGLQMERARDLLRTAVPLQGQMLIDLSQRAMIPVVVGFLFGVAAVGITGMANTLLEALVLQPLVMLGSLQLRLFARIQHDPKGTTALLEQCLAAGAMVLLPPVLLLGITAPSFIPHLLSSRWSEVGDLIFWLTWATAAQIVASPTAQVAKALEELRAPLIGGLINLTMQFIVLVATAPYLGLRAYPLAATIGIIVGTAYIFRRVRRRLTASPLKPLVPICIANLMTAAIWSLAMVFLSSWMLIVAAILAGGVVYLTLLVLLAGDRLGRLLSFVAQACPAAASAWLSHIAGVVERRKLSFFGGRTDGRP